MKMKETTGFTMNNAEKNAYAESFYGNDIGEMKKELHKLRAAREVIYSLIGKIKQEEYEELIGKKEAQIRVLQVMIANEERSIDR